MQPCYYAREYDEEDLREIEQKLSLKLPPLYAQIMTGPDAQLGKFWHRSFYNDPARVVEDTIMVREILESYDLSLKPTLVVINEIDGGDALLLDVEHEAGPLFKYDHETNAVEPFVVTLAECAKL